MQLKETKIWTRLEIGVLMMLLFILPLLISPLEYQYTKEIFALVMISILLMLWGAEMVISSQELKLKMPLPFAGGLLLLLVAALSLIHSRNFLIGLESFVLMVLYTLLYLCVTNHVTKERQFYRLLGMLLIAGTLAALYALIQYFGFDFLPYPRRLSAAEARAMISTMGNRNFLAGFLSYLFFPALMLFFNLQRRQRLLIFVALVLDFTVIIASGTRAAWLGWGAGCLFLIVTVLHFHLWPLLRRNLLWVSTLVGALVVVAMLFTLPTPLSRQTSIPQQVTSGLEALSGPYVRYHDWWIAGEMIREHPLLGIGLGGYKLEFFDAKERFLQTPQGVRYRTMEIPKADQAHNDYLQTWAELGTLGLFVGLGLIILIFYSSFLNSRFLNLRQLRTLKSGLRKEGKAERELNRKLFITLTLQAGLIALLVHAFFSFPFHLPTSMLEFVVFAGLLESPYLAQRDMIKLKLGQRSRVALAAALLLLAITISTLALRDLAAEVYLQKGERLLATGATEQAKAELERSLKLDFAPKKVLFDLGLIYMDSDLARAEQFFLRSLNTSASDLAAYLNLAEIARIQSDYEKALRYVEQGQKIDPANPEFMYLRAWLTAQIRRPQKALSILQKLNDISDSYYRAKSRALAGDIYLYLLNDREKALDNYQQALTEAQAALEQLQQRWQGKVAVPRQYRKIIERAKELQDMIQKLREAIARLGD